MTTAQHERMSRVDTAWLRMDSPGNPMVIVSVSMTETPIHYGDFRATLERRFLCFPRFRKRPASDALGASWVEDENFDLDAHLVRVRSPDVTERACFQALAAELAATPLDPRRPMWQVHFVEDYQGGSAWIMRIHHCYADGIAMTRVLLSMTEQDAGPAMAARPMASNTTGRQPSIALMPVFDWIGEHVQPAGDIIENALAEGMKLLEGGIHHAFHPQRALALALQTAGTTAEFGKVLALPDDPDTPLRGELTGKRRVAWAEPIALQEVKIIGEVLGCTINDVIMSTVAGVVGGCLRNQGFDTDGITVRASVPVNLRAAEEPLTLGNKFGLVFVDMPIDMRNPLQRLMTMQRTMQSLKGSMQPLMTLQVLGLMGMLPAAAQSPGIDILSRKGSLVLSNVPGPQAPLYMCGQRISEMYFWVPQSGSIGIGISILSYAGKVFFGVISGTGHAPFPDAIVASFTPEFEKLLIGVTVGALAGKENMNRRQREKRSRLGKKRPRRKHQSK